MQPRGAPRGHRSRSPRTRTVLVLVATDAAGEGVNLQRAHLMVNYDLPWNPNRIEQRFGRIHRIGQTEVCHLWNLVADETREGQVFHRLLEKRRRAAQAPRRPGLRRARRGASAASRCGTCCCEAIRYGDQPEVKAQLNQVIDATVGEGLAELVARARRSARDVLSTADLERIRADMVEARGPQAPAALHAAPSSPRRSRCSAAG